MVEMSGPLRDSAEIDLLDSLQLLFALFERFGESVDLAAQVRDLAAQATSAAFLLPCCGAGLCGLLLQATELAFEVGGQRGLRLRSLPEMRDLGLEVEDERSLPAVESTVRMPCRLFQGAARSLRVVK